MGRPLKIQKYSAMSGIFINGPTAEATPVDQAYPQWANVTNAQYPATFNSDQFLGVVGGLSNTGTSANFPIVKCRAYIPDTAAEGDAQIVRQKGAHKFLVAYTGTIDPANAVVSPTPVALRINTVGDTDWAAMGLTGTAAAVGVIFTPTAAAGAGTTGLAQEVGVCVLADEADTSLTEGNMNITYTLDDSTATTISKLTNKFLLNFAGGNPGGVTNTGDAWTYTAVINDDRYLDNFFTDEGTEVKSGSENTNSNATYPGTNVAIAIVENYTS